MLSPSNWERTRKEAARHGCYLRESEADYMSSDCAVTNCTYLSKSLSRANIFSLVVCWKYFTFCAVKIALFWDVTMERRAGRCHLLDVQKFFKNLVSHFKIFGTGRMMCDKFLTGDPTNTRPHGTKFSRLGDLVSILLHPCYWSPPRAALIFG
jgi:hypothetical protein